MKCPRCSAELPAHAQFCMGCGVQLGGGSGARAVVAGHHPASVSGDHRVPTKTLLISAAVLAALAIGSVFGWRALTGRSTVLPGSSQVVQSAGTVSGGPLTERTGRVSSIAPIAGSQGIASPGPPDPTDVIDYLKFLKEVQRQMLMLEKRDMAEILKQSTALTGGNIMGEMDDNPDVRHKQDYTRFQQSVAAMAGEWQQLSQLFLTKAAPASCAQLRDSYYDFLGKAAGSITKTGKAISDAMGGNPGSALDALAGMKGSGPTSASGDIDEAALHADQELANVCDKYKLRKDFDIKSDSGGGGSLLR